MRRLPRVALVVLLLGNVDAVSAQTGPVRLTLDEAIARGLEASERLEELTARQEAARAVEAQREAAARPQVAAIAGYTRTNHVEEFGVANAAGEIRVLYPDVPNNIRSRFDLQWPIYTGGRVGALTRAAGAEAEAIGHDRDAARADLKLEITRSFWAVITARASSDVVRQALDRTSAHLDDVRNQLGVGLVPPSDVLTIEAQHAHQRMLSIEAENIVETNSAEFRRLAGLEPEVPFELVADLRAGGAALKVGTTGPSPSGPGLVSQDPATVAAARTARENRAERKSLQFRITAAAERVTAAEGGALPVLMAIGGYDVRGRTGRFFRFRTPGSRRGMSASIFGGRSSTEDEAGLKRPRRWRFDAGRKLAFVSSTSSFRWRYASGWRT